MTLQRGPKARGKREWNLHGVPFTSWLPAGRAWSIAGYLQKGQVTRLRSVGTFSTLRA